MRKSKPKRKDPHSRIGNDLRAPVPEPPQMDVLKQTEICDILKKVAGANIGVDTIVYIDPKLWMARITLPDGSAKRYRCDNGKVVDEATIGN